LLLNHKFCLSDDKINNLYLIGKMISLATKDTCRNTDLISLLTQLVSDGIILRYYEFSPLF